MSSLNKQSGATQQYAGSGYHSTAANNALSRWLTQQQQAQDQFTAAQQPLQQAVDMFQTGGGYGEGQKALLEQQAKQTQAQALSNQVASGMSSGSMATGTQMRTSNDLANSLAGVEDTRTTFLNQALQALSGAQQGQAQTTSAATDPTYAPYQSAQASIYGSDQNYNASTGRTATPKTAQQQRTSVSRNTAKY